MTDDGGGSDNTEREQHPARSLKPEKDAATGRFITGNSGSGGRPKGARAKLGEAFLAALAADFEEGGADAAERVRIEDPSTYMRVIASTLPKELNVSTVADLSDEQIDQRIQQLAVVLGLEVRRVDGDGGPGEEDEDGVSGPH